MNEKTILRDAVFLLWTLPRPKKYATGIFFAQP